MFKKFLVVSVLAVVVGGFFLTSTEAGRAVLSKTRPGETLLIKWDRWWERKEKKLLTPEDRITQLRREVKKIDQSIKDEISELAEMEVKYEAEERSVKSLRTRQDILESRMTLLEVGIEQKKTQVVFEDKKSVSSNEFARELVKLTKEFETGKKTLETREQILKARKEAVETRHAKVKAMKEARDELLVAIEELEAEIELMRLKQVEGRTGDDNSVGRTQELLDKTRARVRVLKKEAELNARYDDKKATTVTTEPKVSDEEALEQARKARGVKPKAEVKEDVKKTD